MTAHEKRELTEGEIKALVTKAEAEAEYFRQQARKEAAEADVAMLKATERQRMEDAELAEDDYHRVYRFVGDVSATSAKQCMEKLTEWHRLDPECDIEVVFNSPGGGITDGMALFDHLRMLSDAGHKIITGAQGHAASMAGILLQAGDERWMTAQSWVLIHQAGFGASGKTYEIQDRVKWVERIQKRIIDIFVERSDGKLTSRKIKRNWKRKDWWLDSTECVELGLVDEVR